MKHTWSIAVLSVILLCGCMSPPEDMERNPPPVLEYEEELIQPDLLNQTIPETLYQIDFSVPVIRTQEENHAWMGDMLKVLELPTEGLSYRLWDPPNYLESAENEDIMADAYQEGAFNIFRKGRPDLPGCNWAATIRINEGEALTGSYQVDGQPYALQDAADYCADILERLRPYMTTVTDYRLRTVMVAQAPGSEDYTYVFRYELLEYGLPLDEADLLARADKFFRPTYLEIAVSVPNNFDRVSLAYPVTIQKMQPLEEDILTAAEALETAENTLARYSGYKVRNMELRYCCESAPGQMEALTYLPYWCLRIAEDNSAPSSLVSNLDPRTTIYVNAVTGKVHVADVLGMVNRT